MQIAAYESTTVSDRTPIYFDGARYLYARACRVNGAPWSKLHFGGAKDDKSLYAPHPVDQVARAVERLREPAVEPPAFPGGLPSARQDKRYILDLTNPDWIYVIELRRRANSDNPFALEQHVYPFECTAVPGVPLPGPPAASLVPAPLPAPPAAAPVKPPLPPLPLLIVPR